MAEKPPKIVDLFRPWNFAADLKLFEEYGIDPTRLDQPKKFAWAAMKDLAFAANVTPAMLVLIFASSYSKYKWED